MRQANESLMVPHLQNASFRPYSAVPFRHFALFLSYLKWIFRQLPPWIPERFWTGKGSLLPEAVLVGERKEQQCGEVKTETLRSPQSDKLKNTLSLNLPTWQRTRRAIEAALERCTKNRVPHAASANELTSSDWCAVCVLIDFYSCWNESTSKTRLPGQLTELGHLLSQTA